MLNKNIPIYEPSFSFEDKENLIKCIDTGWISSQGEFIEMFENSFAKWNDVSYGVASSNCTTALHLALKALDIGPGDEVICPDLSFIAPANMIRVTGARAVLVDVDLTSWCLSPSKIIEKITHQTKAIIVVHVFGHAASMDEIMAIANKYNLAVIEDVAEAPGAMFKGKKVGTFGHIACYSFFANKIMTTGEGGISITSDSSLAKKMRIYRDHGMSRERRYVHEVVGFNYRMTNMQAAIGVAQLNRLDDLLEQRLIQESKYKKLFERTKKINWRPVCEWTKHVHWMSTITLDIKELRDPLLHHMASIGIDCRQMIYPIHMAQPYLNEGSDAEYPNTTNISLRSLHIPSSLKITEDQQYIVANSIIEWVEKNG